MPGNQVGCGFLGSDSRCQPDLGIAGPLLVSRLHKITCIAAHRRNSLLWRQKMILTFVYTALLLYGVLRLTLIMTCYTCKYVHL